MGYKKKILCLANSRKLTGRCIAGKEVRTKSFGGWVRPVSGRPGGEISEEERRYPDGTGPQVLDIISVPLLKAHPHGCQNENHLIDDTSYWQKVGKAGWKDLEGAVDTIRGELWVNEYHSFNGLNDRIPVHLAAELGGSLVLVHTANLVIAVAPEGAIRVKRKVRAEFSLNGAPYKLTVTDPVIEANYLGKPDGEYSIKSAYVCVSVGEPYDGYCYKLVAGVIAPARAKGK